MCQKTRCLRVASSETPALAWSRRGGSERGSAMKSRASLATQTGLTRTMFEAQPRGLAPIGPSATHPRRRNRNEAAIRQAGKQQTQALAEASGGPGTPKTKRKRVPHLLGLTSGRSARPLCARLQALPKPIRRSEIISVGSPPPSPGPQVNCKAPPGNPAPMRSRLRKSRARPYTSRLKVGFPFPFLERAPPTSNVFPDDVTCKTVANGR